MKFTILGSTGFIGRSLVSHLRGLGHDVETPPKDIENLRGKNLGHVIYAIGMTGNFRTQPEKTIDAHVTVLQKLITGAEFESWLYLSSARVYRGAKITKETEALSVSPSADSLYDLSKLLGEAICLGHKNPAVRVARLSNVYGVGMSQHLFLGSILQDLAKNGKVTIGEAPVSSKDYIFVETVVKILTSIATKGRERLYNVASGQPETHQNLADIIQKCGYSVEFAKDAAIRVFPTIETTRITEEFGKHPSSVLEDLPSLIEQTKKEYKA